MHNLVSLSGVLRSLQEAGIPFVVMGGQAVGAHGASEGSRDLDIYLAPTARSVEHLIAWLGEVRAQLRYLPPVNAAVLERGHTVHYDVPFGTSSVVRLDVCTRPARIVDPENLSARAMPYTLADGTTILVMGLSDLIQTKKTQRLKDWGAIEMLLAASIATSPDPSEALVCVWLEELRDAEPLEIVAAAQPDLAARLAEHRPALAAALAGDGTGAREALMRELQDGMEAERAYQRWLTRTRSHATGGTSHRPAADTPDTISDERCRVAARRSNDRVSAQVSTRDTDCNGPSRMLATGRCGL